MEKLNAIDEDAFEQQTQDLTPEEKSKIKNLVDRFEIGGYVRNSFSGFDKTNNLYFSDSGEDNTTFKMDTYIVGDMFDKALNVKLGKWNEWNPYGWGMDIDCDFSGV